MTFDVGNRLPLVVVLILIILSTLTFVHIDWNDELQIVLLVVVINIFSTTWFSRNQLRFDNKIIFLQFIHELIKRKGVLLLLFLFAPVTY